HIGFKDRINKNTKKQTILFLPSWEDQNSLDWILSAAKKLKKDYSTIVKLHPFGDFGTDITKSVRALKEELQKTVDEYYDGEAPLGKLLSRSDLVISDVSAAVFDALYVRIPVLVYSKQLHRFDAEGLKSACAKYIDEGYISSAK